MGRPSEESELTKEGSRRNDSQLRLQTCQWRDRSLQLIQLPPLSSPRCSPPRGTADIAIESVPATYTPQEEKTYALSRAIARKLSKADPEDLGSCLAKPIIYRPQKVPIENSTGLRLPVQAAFIRLSNVSVSSRQVAKPKESGLVRDRSSPNAPEVTKLARMKPRGSSSSYNSYLDLNLIRLLLLLSSCIVGTHLGAILWARGRCGGEGFGGCTFLV